MNDGSVAREQDSAWDYDLTPGSLYAYDTFQSRPELILNKHIQFSFQNECSFLQQATVVKHDGYCVELLFSPGGDHKWVALRDILVWRIDGKSVRRR